MAHFTTLLLPPMADPPQSWADLPDDPLHEIVRRLPCLADRDRMAQVCRGWRSAIPRCPPPTPPAPLPWLLLPSAGGEPIRILCVSDGCRPFHRISALHGARIFGSFSGGWIFAAVHQTCGHALINLRTSDPVQSALPVPDLLRSTRGDQCVEEMVILAATLSSPPDGDTCIGAGIIKRLDLIAGPRQVVFWRMGDGVAVDAMPHVLHQPGLELEDVIYYHGSFYLLTEEEHLRCCDPVIVEGVGLHLASDEICWFEDREHLQDEHVVARYLVESRGDLLMVVRLGNFSGGCKLPTTTFMVFEATEGKVTSDGGEVPYVWKKIDLLDGRILFVGRGCSRSFEAKDYLKLGLEEGVFYLDDETFHDEAVMFWAASDRNYPCSDNGFWSACLDQINHCFAHNKTSAFSSPGWLMP